MESIRDITQRSMQQKGMGLKIQEHLVIGYANQLMINFWGDRVRDKAQALYVRNSILTIALLDERMLSDWQMRQEEFIKNINNKFGIDIIKTLRILT